MNSARKASATKECGVLCTEVRNIPRRRLAHLLPRLPGFVTDKRQRRDFQPAETCAERGQFASRLMCHHAYAQRLLAGARMRGTETPDGVELVLALTNQQITARIDTANRNSRSSTTRRSGDDDHVTIRVGKIRCLVSPISNGKRAQQPRTRRFQP